MSNLFNGSRSSQSSSSQSSNQAYPFLQNAYSGLVNTGNSASTQLADMLGLNGSAAQTAGFNNWQNSTGYQFGLNQGLQSINGNAAATGLLNSGATAKALETYGQNYANTQYGNYTNQLQSLLGSGLAAGGLIGSAGNVSTSQSSGSSSSNKGGLGQALIGGLLTK